MGPGAGSPLPWPGIWLWVGHWSRVSGLQGVSFSTASVGGRKPAPRTCLLTTRRYSYAPASGCSSVVERNLAKVDVVSSNLISRSTRGTSGDLTVAFFVPAVPVPPVAPGHLSARRVPPPGGAAGRSWSAGSGFDSRTGCSGCTMQVPAAWPAATPVVKALFFRRLPAAKI